MTNKHSLWIFSTLTIKERGLIFDAIESVNPLVVKWIKKRYQVLKLKTALHRRLVKEGAVPPEILVGDVVGVKTAVESVSPGFVIRFMDMSGLKKILALALVAGYSQKEVAALAKMDEMEMMSMVNPEDLVEAKKRLPAAVAEIADSIVMQDLLKGEITSRTVEADRISARRRKVAVDVSAETRARNKVDDDAVREDRESHVKSRFGVDRTIVGEEVNEDHKG